MSFFSPPFSLKHRSIACVIQPLSLGPSSISLGHLSLILYHLDIGQYHYNMCLQPISLRCNTSLVPMPHGFLITLGLIVTCHYGLCQ